MNTSKLKVCMLNFGIEKLKNFLGGNLVDTMIEWTPDNQTLFTKSKLIDMILTVHGVGILKNKEFRKSLLQTFRKDDILSFKELLTGTDRQINDLVSLTESVSSVVWRNNKVSNKVLEILDIQDDVFTSQNNEELSQEVLSSNDRFYELLDYQFVIKQRILSNLNSGIELNRMLVHMPTGTGKTKTAMHTLCHYYNFNLNKKGLIIWLAHTTELLQQAYDTFNSVWLHLGKDDVIAYKLWGSHTVKVTDDEINGVMFCGIQKLMSIASTNPTLMVKLINDCRLIVFDEAHKAAATETKNAVEKLMIKKQDMQDRALIGLTATPGRSTEMSMDNDLLTSMFGNKIISIDTEIMNYINFSKIEALNTSIDDNIITYFQRKRILAKIKKEQLAYVESLSQQDISQIRVTATINGYDDFSAKTLETIGRNKSRNLSIMRRLRELNTDKVPTIVFACSVEHGQLLSSMLSIEGIPNALVIGDMLPQERTSAIKAFKDRDNPINILINYEVLTTGFDSTNIRCVFIARPTQSVVLYSQMLGRGLRGPQMGGNEECLLIDMKDNLERYNEKMAFAHFDNYWKV